jgi:hypothetical protein
MIASIAFLSFVFSQPRIANDPLVELGIPPTAVASFRKLVVGPLRQPWVQEGVDKALKFKPSSSNSSLDGVLKGLDKKVVSDVRSFVSAMEQGFGKDGKGDDASQYIALILAFSLESNGMTVGDDTPNILASQVRFLANSASWSKFSDQDRTDAANVAKALVALEVLASAGGKTENSVKLTNTIQNAILGSGAILETDAKWFKVKSTQIDLPPESAVTPGSDSTLPEANGYQSANYGGRPGLTKMYPDYPGTTKVAFVLQPIASRSYKDFLGAWKSGLPGPEWSGEPFYLPIARYVGNGARATMSYSQIKRSPEGFSNMIVYNFETGGQSQALVGFFLRADLINEIIRDMEGVIAKMQIKGASYAPLTTNAQIAGTWTTHGASQMGYFSASNGAMVGATAIDRGLEYTFNSNGTFSYRYQGVTGVIGAMKADEDNQTGTYAIERDLLVLKPKGKPQRTVRLRGLVQLSDNSKVLLMSGSTLPVEAEFAYIEKFVLKKK